MKHPVIFKESITRMKRSKYRSLFAWAFFALGLLLLSLSAFAADQSDSLSLMVGEDYCKTAECFIVINSADGKEVVRISERTGKVTLAHPDKLDEASRQFWIALTQAFGQLKCAP